MKILIICSKKFYSKIEEIKHILENNGHEVLLPNCYDNPNAEKESWNLGKEEHQKFKAQMYKQSEDTISNVDAVLVLNFDKESDNGVLKNYIGGATFLEMYDAFRLGKTIYLYNDIPNGMLYDEIEGFNPIVINGNLDLINRDIDLKLYDNKLVKLNDGDRVYEGICSYYCEEYNYHEYGVEEESLQLGSIIFYKSSIKKIELIDNYTSKYGSLEELTIESGIDLIDEVFESENNDHIYRLLLCIKDKFDTFYEKDELIKLLENLIKYNKDDKIIKVAKSILND